MGADRRPYSIMPVSFFSQVASSVRKRFLDTFSARSNTTGSLGTATDGSSWDAVNGTIQVTTGAATATTTPSAGSAGTAYPMATVTLPVQNNSISLGGTNEGSSVALWVQSSSDWWLVNVEGTQTTNTNYASAQSYNYAFAQNLTYGTSTNYYGVTNYYSASGYYSQSGGTTYNVGYRTVGSPFAYQAFYSSTAGGTTYYLGTSYYGATSYYTATGYSITYGAFYQYTSAGAFYTYAAGSTTAYNEYLKIRQSVASTVSIIASSLISTTQSIKSLIVSTSGNQITAKAFSDSNFVTQIGSDLVHTATGATINTKYGIAVSPSAYNQSAIIGTSVNITRN
jgi:hypothetical protein